jgi:hypothetical protein
MSASTTWAPHVLCTSCCSNPTTISRAPPNDVASCDADTLHGHAALIHAQVSLPHWPTTPQANADDRRPWRPAPDAEALWVRLRLVCVAALWKAHCRRHDGNGAPLVTVIAGLVFRVREIMARDAADVGPDGPLVATVGGAPFRRRYPPSLGRPFCPAGAIVTPSAPGPQPLRGPSST